jgi:hypothetical protein
MSGTSEDADTIPSDVEQPDSNVEQLDEADTHTDRDAPTDEAHRDAGDGTLTGSMPA